jgi:putative endonuclease
LDETGRSSRPVVLFESAQRWRYHRAVSAPIEFWFVYLVRCNDGTLYTGIARDVTARIAKHDAGRGARYTRGRGPLTLCAKKRCRSKSEALRLELAIKRLPRDAKQKLTAAVRLQAFARAHRRASSV